MKSRKTLGLLLIALSGLTTLSTLAETSGTVRNSEQRVPASAISSLHQFPLPQVSPDASLSVVAVDGGMSTDVSPRYQIVVGFFSPAEMGNLDASFLLTNTVWDVQKVRLESNHLILRVREISDEFLDQENSTIFADVIYRLDIGPLIQAEAQRRQSESCLESFCDGELDVTLPLTRSAVPARDL